MVKATLKHLPHRNVRTALKNACFINWQVSYKGKLLTPIGTKVIKIVLPLPKYFHFINRPLTSLPSPVEGHVSSLSSGGAMGMAKELCELCLF